MQQTKNHSNVMLSSLSGRKINKQIKTRETGAAWHKAYYSHWYECKAA